MKTCLDLRRLSAARLLVLFGCVVSTPSYAYYIYSDPPACGPCSDPRPAESRGGLSLSEGNLSEAVAVTTAESALGPTLAFSLTYNSYNADGTRAMIDTVLGNGWTHSFNDFLFSQRGHMFRSDGRGRITIYRLGAGGTYTAETGIFQTLVKNGDGSFTLREKNGTMYRFALVAGTPFLVGGPVYQLLSIVDRNGNTTTLSYTGGLLTLITDPFGRTLQLAYNAQKKLVSVTDPLGRTTTFTYDATGHQLTGVAAPLGRTLTYQYNSLNQLTRKTDADGRVVSYSYVTGKPGGKSDGVGSPMLRLQNAGNWSVNEAVSGPSLERVYTPASTTQVDGRGNAWRYDYDANGYVTRAVAPDGAVTTYTYDPATLMLASTTDANGHTTSYQYDSQGNVTKQTNALGQVTSYTYEATFNNVTSVTDNKGRVTTFQYDSRGNRTGEVDALGETRAWTYDAHGNVLAETDRRGNTTSYTYTSGGNLAAIIAPAPLGYVTLMTYDAAGNRLSTTDPNGHTTSFQYDALNRLISRTDGAGNSEQYGYDHEGNLVSRADRNHHTTIYAYDLRGRVISVTDATGHATTSTYDGNDNLASVTDRDGQKTTYQYDVQNRPFHTIDAIGGSTTSTYDPAGNVITYIDAKGRTNGYQYDPLNRPVRVTDGAGFVTSYVYDTGGTSGCTTCGSSPGSPLVTMQTDGNGKVTYYKYDELDRLTKVVRKEGDVADVIDGTDAVTSFAYDANGNRVLLTEPNGNPMSTTFDVVNRRTTLTNAAGDLTRYAYDGVGNLVTTTLPNGNVITNTYDAVDRVIQVDDLLARVANYTYDAVGNRLSQADGNGSTYTYNYDPLDRIVQNNDPLGHGIGFQFDPNGNLLRLTDREGSVTTYGYDALNRRTSLTDAAANVTTYKYDAVGNLVTVIDANSHTTTFQYDGLNRRVRETYPDPVPNTRTFGFDAVNLISRTDQAGQTTAYTYNDLYFLMRRTYPAGPTDAMTYDLSGRMLSATRGSWLVTFSYDGANRIVGTSQNGLSVGYAYDIPGRTLRTTYPGGRVIDEQMDLRDQLVTAADGGTPLVQYAYDAGGHTTSRTYANGVVATYTYNANDWALSIEHQAGATRIAGFGYAYDNDGNKRSEERRHDPTKSEAYQYDALHRLVDYKVGALVGSTVPLPSTQTSYSLDAVGNWASKTTDSVPQTRTHGPANELVKIDATSLLYDADGNLRQDATYSFAYDEENRLVRVTRNADARVVGEYQYDAIGRRVQKIANPGVAPTTTRYFYDDARVIEETDGGGATAATYVYGRYLDEVVVMTRGAQTYYYHEDELGSEAAITDAAGAPVERMMNDAYGVLAFTDGAGSPITPNAWGTAHSAIGNPYGFTGRAFDEETGLYYYRARMYDPAKGRFLQRDPLGYAAGLNLYEYVHSRPTLFVDPDGMDVTEKPNADYEYTDEFYKGGADSYDVLAPRIAQAVKDKKLTEKQAAEFTTALDSARVAVKNLKSLKGKKCPTIKVYYLTKEGVADYATHAARDNKQCTISWYFGHGSGTEADVKKVKDTLGGKNVPDGAKGACQAPRYGVYSCFAGRYNSVINEANRLSAPLDINTETVGPELATHFNSNFAATNKTIEEMCKCCDDKVELRLYFGAQGKRDDPKAARDSTFDKW